MSLIDGSVENYQTFGGLCQNAPEQPAVTVVPPGTILSLDSVTGDGSVGAPLMLVNDVLSPPNHNYYGTDGLFGLKGFHTLANVGLLTTGTMVANDGLGGAGTLIIQVSTLVLGSSPGARGIRNVQMYLSYAAAATSAAPSTILFDDAQIQNAIGDQPFNPVNMSLTVTNTTANLVSQMNLACDGVNGTVTMTNLHGLTGVGDIFNVAQFYSYAF